MNKNLDSSPTSFLSGITALVLIPLVFALGLGVGYLIWGRASMPVVASAQPTPTGLTDAPDGEASEAPQPTEPQTVRRYPVPVDDDPSIGPDDAAITLIEFSDYECPFCARWHTEVFGRLLEKYPDQLRFVYRDLPLPSHPNAAPAAEAVGCAHEQGAFWEFHDQLFTTTQAFGTDLYLEIALGLDLDIDQFTECVENRTYQEEVQADFQYAAGLGVSSTPTFFLNGIPIVGAQPFEFFDEVVRRELAGEIP